MQEILKFKLKGLTGILKRPESNVIYFSYNNIHKIAILGILGAINGENGYNYNSLFKDKKDELPEFYTHLSKFKIAVEPLTDNGTFSKNMVSFNNSVGYASKEEGNNLIVSEQWIENPAWNIYILSDDSDEYIKLKNNLLERKCEYIPYIGKNDHFANISCVEVFENVKEASNIDKIASIFTDKEYVVDENVVMLVFENDDEYKYEMKEVLPTELHKKVGYAKFKEFSYTNKSIKVDNTDNVYNVNGRNVFFF